jgi:hypothetical protein
MALIFCDGFDHYDRNLIHNKWDYSGGSPWYGECYIAEGLGRFGTNALELKDSWQQVMKAMPHGPLGFVTAGVAFNPQSGLTSAGAMIISFVTGTTVLCGVAVTATHNLYYWSGSNVWYSNKPIRTNAYNYIEIQVDRFHGVCGTVRVWLNEVKVIEQIWIDSNGGSGISVAEAVMLGGHATWVRTDYPAPGILYDDFYLTDQTGLYNTSNLGDVRVVEQMPLADHDKEWTRNGGDDNYALVDDTYDAVDEDTTYITSQTPDVKDTYEFPELPTESGEVKAVCMNFFAKKLDSGTRGVSMLAHRNGTYVASDENRVGGNYIYYQSYMERDLDGATQWTLDSVESTYFGPKLTT